MLQHVQCPCWAVPHMRLINLGKAMVMACAIDSYKDKGITL